MTFRPCGGVIVALCSLLLACGDNSGRDCSELFGAPSANTGLTSSQCSGTCACLDFAPPTYRSEQIARFETLELVDPFELLESSPYAAPNENPDRSTMFCGVLVSGQSYRLETFATRAALEAAGARLTHTGACGRCSTLADLAVYIGNGDLAGPVRQCGVDTIADGEPANTACLIEIGFTPPCAQIWAYNTIHTRENCLALCFAALNDPYHLPDGTLNECIQCDEDSSGAVFKAVAGRTRRNSGLPSALCRPCASVSAVVHDY